MGDSVKVGVYIGLIFIYMLVGVEFSSYYFICRSFIGG